MAMVLMVATGGRSAGGGGPADPPGTSEAGSAMEVLVQDAQNLERMRTSSEHRAEAGRGLQREEMPRSLLLQ